MLREEYLNSILQRILISEKTARRSSDNQLVFWVTRTANKRDIKDALILLFGSDVLIKKVCTVVMKVASRSRSRSRQTPKSRLVLRKKAYVCFDSEKIVKRIGAAYGLDQG